MNMGQNPITTATYDQRITELGTLCRQIIAEKRAVYTHGSDDVIHNFRMNAMLANGTVGQALAFGLVKQICAVVSLLTDPSMEDAERDTRFADARNYLDLAYVSYKEGQLR